jgi:hypothetical protein
MSTESAPIMQIRQSDEDGWKVAATWPDGSSEEIGKFASETDANKWVADKLQEWLDERKDRQGKE